MARFKRTTTIRLPSFYLRGWFSILLVVGVMILLIAGLGRVVVNAKNNYDVFQFEKRGLEQLKSENVRLESELGYYRSYEFKRLYARDYLNIAEPGERLYRVVGAGEYYDVPQKREEFFKDGKYLEWWLILI